MSTFAEERPPPPLHQETALPATAHPGTIPPTGPHPGIVDLWMLHLPQADDQAQDTPGLDTSVLSPDEQRRACAFARPRDRLRYTFAHTALRRLLGAQLGLPPQDLAFTREPCPCCGAPHGRPALADPPLPLHFSLSHGGDLVLIGTAAVPVGVDVEPVPAPSVVADLAGVMHPAEQAELAAAPAARRPAAFTRLWARKEAYLKALGTGLGRDLAADYLGTTGLAAPPTGWTVTDLPAGPSHAAACAAPSPAAPTTL
ncbi:4'-phosphopantetheinyl transferase superfamily protein [Streptomyces sp. NPDC005408]|uniref:4'-phosphopantetheinyl transferase family protein n=1 Tax=Streptomyces sp. NPDC005408 TaxID=3155341 RepID=UPI0033A7CF4E